MEAKTYHIKFKDKDNIVREVINKFISHEQAIDIVCSIADIPKNNIQFCKIIINTKNKK